MRLAVSVGQCVEFQFAIDPDPRKADGIEWCGTKPIHLIGVVGIDCRWTALRIDFFFMRDSALFAAPKWRDRHPIDGIDARPRCSVVELDGAKIIDQRLLVADWTIDCAPYETADHSPDRRPEWTSDPCTSN